MGFYSPATIIEDAKRHGVRLLPADVLKSGWDCTLEHLHGQRFAVRMGLRYVSGLGAGDWNRIESASRQAAFASLPDFLERTDLDEGALLALAQAGAFDGFRLSRRDALWLVKGRKSAPKATLPLPAGEKAPTFSQLPLPELVNWDYLYLGHSVRGHPMAGLRQALQRLGLPNARAVNRMRNGRRVRFVGAVINRQRPGTANGVTFMTLEDETGWVNLIVWETVFHRFPVVAKTAPLLGVTGKLQTEAGVVHLIAEELWVPDVASHPKTSPSRDFR